MKLVIFGFFRDVLDKDHVHGPIKHLDKYIYAPTLRHELEEEVITEEQVRQKFTNVKSIHLYDYNQKVKLHHDYVDKMKPWLPEIIGPKQKPYRTLSFFYNMKESLKLLPKNLPKDELIILARADSNITYLNGSNLQKAMKNHDILCTGFRGQTAQVAPSPNIPGEGRSVIDHVFILKPSAIQCFIDLYEDMEDYLYKRYKNFVPKDKLNSLPDDTIRITIPETIFWFHFHVKGMRVYNQGWDTARNKSIHYHIQHHIDKPKFLHRIMTQK
jgi:hypothetical protein